ncbi:MAG: hypothetical protein R3A45_09635 [Bdellovibrionota bacterium]
MAKKTFLLDGSAIAYRSHFAFGASPLTNKKGMDTSACFGFANTLFRILEQEKPDYIAVVFDTPEPTFRHKMFSEYKATRETMPDELRVQLPIIREMVEAMNIPFIKKDGLEADDIIGTLAYQAQALGHQVYMVTGDKDFMQLLKPNIFMYSLQKKSKLDVLDASAPEQKWGIPVQHVTDMLALMAMPVITCLVYPALAKRLLLNFIQTFGGLDEIYHHIGDVKPQRIQDKITSIKSLRIFAKTWSPLSPRLSLPSLRMSSQSNPMETTELKRIFKELEFQFPTSKKIQSQISAN